MTQESLNIADTYKQIADAEKQALALEKMLDDLDSKMDSILDQIQQNDEEIKTLQQSEEPAPTPSADSAESGK